MPSDAAMQAELEAIYHPPLDPALIAAIISDVDDVQSAKDTLDVLQAEAIADGFEEGYHSPTLSTTQEDDDDKDDSGSIETTDGIDDETLRFLKLSFPKQSLTTLKFVLRKCNDDILKSTDELLNHEFIDEEKKLNAIVDGGERGGTVDDFFSSDTAFRTQMKRTRRARKGEKQRGTVVPNELDPGVLASRPTLSKWTQMGSEVEWLSRVLSLSKSTVQSVYHAHNSSLPGSLNALLESTTWVDASKDHPDHADNYARLIKSYPSLGGNKVLEILNATKEQLTLANEVANVLLAWRPSIGNITSGLQSTKLSASAPSRTEGTPTHHDGKSAAECRDLANALSSKRDAAFRQAAEAYQRSKSDGLMGGTAMYYSELGREYDRQRQIYKMRAAELSSTQRSGDRDELDLHGLSVHESLVIVKHAVTDWYSRTRMLESGTLLKPLKIVTGLGRHSTGGEARLLPAIKKYLDREGWQYDVAGGMILVTGLAKRK